MIARYWYWKLLTEKSLPLDDVIFKNPWYGGYQKGYYVRALCSPGPHNLLKEPMIVESDDLAQNQ